MGNFGLEKFLYFVVASASISFVLIFPYRVFGEPIETEIVKIPQKRYHTEGPALPLNEFVKCADASKNCIDRKNLTRECYDGTAWDDCLLTCELCKGYESCAWTECQPKLDADGVFCTGKGGLCLSEKQQLAYCGNTTNSKVKRMRRCAAGIGDAVDVLCCK